MGIDLCARADARAATDDDVPMQTDPISKFCTGLHQTIRADFDVCAQQRAVFYYRRWMNGHVGVSASRIMALYSASAHSVVPT